MITLDLFWTFGIFFGFFLLVFWIFLDFFELFDFFFNFLGLILVFFLGGISFKVTKVSTKSYQGQNSIIRSFFPQRAKKAVAEGHSPPQELEVGPPSRLYLLVLLKSEKLIDTLNIIHMKSKISIKNIIGFFCAKINTTKTM